MGDWKHNGKHGKIGIPRHRVQSGASSDIQERAIEKATRQATRKVIRAEYPPEGPPCRAAVYGECDCRKCQGL
jgi:hypothetical protein